MRTGAKRDCPVCDAPVMTSPWSAGHWTCVNCSLMLGDEHVDMLDRKRAAASEVAAVEETLEPHYSIVIQALAVLARVGPGGRMHELAKRAHKAMDAIRRGKGSRYELAVVQRKLDDERDTNQKLTDLTLGHVAAGNKP